MWLRTLVVEIVVFGVIASAATALAWGWNKYAPSPRFPPATGVVVTAAVVGALNLAGVIDLEVHYSHGRLTSGGAAKVAYVAVTGVVVVSAVYALWLNRHLAWAPGSPSPWPLRRAISLSMPMVAVTAATIGLAFEGAKAPIFPAVAIVKTERAGQIDGFFVGETSSEIFVGTDLCQAPEHHLRRLLLVPRTEIAALAMTSSVRVTDGTALKDAWGKLHVCGR